MIRQMLQKHSHAFFYASVLEIEPLFYLDNKQERKEICRSAMSEAASHLNQCSFSGMTFRNRLLFPAIKSAALWTIQTFFSGGKRQLRFRVQRNVRRAR